MKKLNSFLDDYVRILVKSIEEKIGEKVVSMAAFRAKKDLVKYLENHQDKKSC